MNFKQFLSERSQVQKTNTELFHLCTLFVVQSLSHIQLFATPWTVTCQATLSMGFSRQKYWSGQPFASPGDLPDPGTELPSPALQVDSSPAGPPGKSIHTVKKKSKFQRQKSDEQLLGPGVEERGLCQGERRV